MPVRPGGWDGGTRPRCTAENKKKKNTILNNIFRQIIIIRIQIKQLKTENVTQ